MTPMETALTFYFTTGVLGCLGLAIFGHRTILDVAIGLCALGVVATFWRNRRRLQRPERSAAPTSPATRTPGWRSPAGGRSASRAARRATATDPGDTRSFAGCPPAGCPSASRGDLRLW